MCKYEERCHPHPTPTHPTQQKTSYGVASTMCASARNILCLKHRKCVQVRGTLPSPPHPNPSHPTKNIIWRSIDHACKCKKHPVLCKCKERYHPHLTPPQPMKLGQTPPSIQHVGVNSCFSCYFYCGCCRFRCSGCCQESLLSCCYPDLEREHRTPFLCQLQRQLDSKKHLRNKG